MSDELAIYKQNRINDINRNFNNNLSRLNSGLSTNIRTVQMSRNRNKQMIVNALVSKYYNDVSILRRNLNSSIAAIRLFKPEFNIVNATNKKALLIGINYINTPYELSGCIDDANRMKEFLSKRGFNSFEILTDLTNVKPTKKVILDKFKEMIVKAVAHDILFFYFSGHGSQTIDRNGDETDRRDETIIALDQLSLIDDDLKTILSTNMKRDVTVFCMFDSCHSGTMLDLKYNYLDSNNYDKYTENDKAYECEGNVIMISGCMDSQTSTEALIDNKAQGAMTWSFIESINKTPNCSWRELLKSMRDSLKNSSFTQLPQLSTDSFCDVDSKLFI